MEKNRTFYYIDESGNKKKYVGAIIDNHNGTFTGYLNYEEYTDTLVDLEYHPAIEKVEGSQAYYTYMNENNEETKYFGLTKSNEDGSKYFAYTTVKHISLIHKDPEEKVVEHFTYLDAKGDSHVYVGKTPTFENGSYFGIIER